MESRTYAQTYDIGQRVRTVADAAVWPIIRAGTVEVARPSLTRTGIDRLSVRGDGYRWPIAYWADELEPIDG